MNVLTAISNSQPQAIRVYIEPWGEGYTLQPDQDVELKINNSGYQPWVVIVVLPGGDLQLYIEGLQDHQGPLLLGLYDASGALLECT